MPGLFFKKNNNIPQDQKGRMFCLDTRQLRRSVLDLGTGDGRFLGLLKSKRPDIHAVAIDISPIMLELVKNNFADEPNIQIIEHDLGNPLPNMGYFDAVISGLPYSI